MHILEAHIPMKIQCRQEEVWNSRQLRRGRAGLDTSALRNWLLRKPEYELMCAKYMVGWLKQANNSGKRMCSKCMAGWPHQADKCWGCSNITSIFYPG